jgi:hypothetical protein
MDLHAHRSYGMAANPLSWSDIYAWSLFNKIEVLPWEVRAICALDSEMTRWANLSSDERKAEKNKKPATTNMVAEALRANAAPDPKRKPTKRKNSDG